MFVLFGGDCDRGYSSCGRFLFLFANVASVTFSVCILVVITVGKLHLGNSEIPDGQELSIT